MHSYKSGVLIHLPLYQSKKFFNSIPVCTGEQKVQVQEADVWVCRINCHLILAGAVQQTLRIKPKIHFITDYVIQVHEEKLPSCAFENECFKFDQTDIKSVGTMGNTYP